MIGLVLDCQTQVGQRGIRTPVTSALTERRVSADSGGLLHVYSFDFGLIYLFVFYLYHDLA